MSMLPVLAVPTTTTFVVGLDRQQAGVLSLCARIRLQRNRVVAGTGAQHLFELGDQQLVALRLVERHERVDAAESGPGDRDQLRRRVQFHGAGAERDHAAIECQILVRELTHVAHQVGFRVVAVEHRVRQVLGFAHQPGRQAAARHIIGFVEGNVVAMIMGEYVEQLFDVLARGDFIQ